eukprot:UN30153
MFNTTSQEVLDERKSKFSFYLRQIVKIDGIHDNERFKHFLSFDPRKDAHQDIKQQPPSSQIYNINNIKITGSVDKTENTT